jgi:hypothetical protein
MSDTTNPTVVVRVNDYYETETNDPATERLEVKQFGPLVHAPTGYCWDDGALTRRVPNSGDYSALAPDGAKCQITVRLMGFGTRDRRPGERVQLTSKQKFAIRKGEAAKASAQAAKKHDEAEW